MTERTYDIQHVEGGVPIKMWTRGVPVDDKARAQLTRAAQMPFVFRHVAAMPDVHVGIGATVGSVIPTKGAVIPAAVGVDIGCGMMAARTSLVASDLPDEDLAYFPEGTEHFADYVEAVGWAQDFAALNRRMMMTNIIRALRAEIAKPFDAELEAVNCHHNYVTRENHFGENVLVTRKGAVRAAKGVMGIIPGSMGAKSFIVRGLGHAESFESCSHGAGRVMSRNEAKRQVSLAEHVADTAGVECRKDAAVIDETPRAYKPIEAVMAAQADLVEIVHTLKQVVCVKG